MLNNAMKGQYAIGAFNVENTEMITSVISAAEYLHSPVILQTTQSTLKYMSPQLFYANVYTIAQRAKVPVALHLDHGKDIETVEKALGAFYSSVMIDGSTLSLQDNIKLTCQAVNLAKKLNIPVEGELGGVGGKEDDVTGKDMYTNLNDVIKFVKETKVSSLAVGIGTAHGVYKTEPILDVARLAQIQKILSEYNISLPLVLHGASGLSEIAVRECIANGICKVNFATELRQAFTTAVRNYLVKDAYVFDPKKYLTAAKDSVFELVCQKIRVCGSDKKDDI